MTIFYTSIAIIFVFAALCYIPHFYHTYTVWDYQTALHFRHGKLIGTLEAGRHRLWGSGHELVSYDNRIVEQVVQSQEVITSDCATLKLSVVAHWRIVDAAMHHLSARDPNQAIYTVIQFAIRQLISGVPLDEIVEKKSNYGGDLLALVKAGTADYGIEVEKVDIRDVMLGGELKSAYANVLTAKKQSLAKLETARGEAAALRTLANAARLLEKNPDLYRLKYLETLKSASSDGYGNTLIIGVPEELAALAKKS